MLINAMKGRVRGLPVTVTFMLRSEGWVEVNQVKREYSRQREHREQMPVSKKGLNASQCSKDREQGQLVLNFIHWFNKYLLRTYYDIGTILDAEKQQWIKQSPCSHGTYNLGRRPHNNNTGGRDQAIIIVTVIHWGPTTSQVLPATLYLLSLTFPPTLSVGIISTL